MSKLKTEPELAPTAAVLFGFIGLILSIAIGTPVVATTAIAAGVGASIILLGPTLVNKHEEKKLRENQIRQNEIEIEILEQKQKQQEENRRAALTLVVEKVNEHIETLQQKRLQLVRIGDYGELVVDGWQKEIRRFLKATVSDEVLELMELDEKHAVDTLADFVDELVCDKADDSLESHVGADVSKLDGVEYELLCSSLLESHNWEITRTPPTGDNGVDLIAEQSGRKVAIQCKKYGSPVGNKAVQEVYSGMGFYDAAEAVVVSNATFTEAAHQSASKLSVALLHHTQLETL